MPAPYTNTRQRSEAAAAAAQHVIDLELEVEHLHKQLREALNRVNLLEEANRIIHEDLSKAAADRDYYKVRTTVIMTKLQTAGAVILDAMKEPNKGDMDAYAPKPEETRQLGQLVHKLTENDDDQRD